MTNIRTQLDWLTLGFNMDIKIANDADELEITEAFNDAGYVIDNYGISGRIGESEQIPIYMNTSISTPQFKHQKAVQLGIYAMDRTQLEALCDIIGIKYRKNASDDWFKSKIMLAKIEIIKSAVDMLSSGAVNEQ
jgi:hypothetical protein